MSYKGFFTVAILVLLGVVVFYVVIQHDPATRVLDTEIAKHQLENAAKVKRARERAEREIAEAREHARREIAKIKRTTTTPEVQVLVPTPGLRRRFDNEPGFFERAQVPTPTTAESPSQAEATAQEAIAATRQEAIAATTQEVIAATTQEVIAATTPTIKPATAPAAKPAVPMVKCYYCRGRGTVQCTACMTSGGISTGLMPCPTCHLAGKVKCPDCHGNYDRVCTACDGSGRIRVMMGYYGNGRRRYGWRTCRTCGGEGRVIVCHKCNKGWITCPTCKGKRRIGTCPVCKGTKKMPCPKCHGTGFLEKK